MTGVYTMQALEDYDPATALEISDQDQPAFSHVDTTNLGAAFSPSLRSLFYCQVVIPNSSGIDTFPNPTGFALWNGFGVVQAGGNMGAVNGSCFVATNLKNIDTNAVMSHTSYDGAITLPAGVGSIYPYVSSPGSGYTHINIAATGGGVTVLKLVGILDAGGSGALVDVKVVKWDPGITSMPSFTVTGDGSGAVVLAQGPHFQTGATDAGSDGTWRIVTASFGLNGCRTPNGPNLVSPYDQNFWEQAESCECYQFRASANYVQELIPYTVAQNSNPVLNFFVLPMGIDQTWMYGLLNTDPGSPYGLALIPAQFQSAETSSFQKLGYVLYTSGTWTQDDYVRFTFDTSGNSWFFSSYTSSGNCKFRLTEFVPPALGTYGSNALGTMTDKTPWTTGGPNADGTGYNMEAHALAYPCPNIFFPRLPATNQAAAIIKFPKEATSSPTDYTKTFFSCCYCTFTSSPTYDYHSAFITGYMNAAFVSVGSKPTTGMAVVDIREFNAFLAMTPFVYPDTNYTVMVLQVQFYPIVASTIASTLQVGFAFYYLASGLPPSLITFFNGSNWDAAYAAYGTAIANAQCCAASLLNGGSIVFSGDQVLTYTPDIGLWDTTSGVTNPVMYFSGVTAPEDSYTGLPFNNMMYLNAAFTPRAAYNAALGINAQQLDPPILRLSFDPATPPIVKVRKWLRSWRAHPQANIHSQRYNVLEIDMEPGVAPAGSDPRLVLRYTDDGHTWSAEHHASSGLTGDYGKRVRFRRLGMERRGLASDRVFELSGTDTCKIVIIGADVS